jgi:hypothetical protein
MRLAPWLRLVGIAGMTAGMAATLFGQATESPRSDEYLLLGNVDRGAGEPWVIVNPKDPRNILVVAMATLNRLPDGETPILPRGTAAATQQRIRELSTPDGSLTAIAVTHDGGKTWSFSEDDLRKIYDKNRCSDSFAGAGPDGTLYKGCLAYLNRGAADYKDGYAPNGEAHFYHGGSAIERSGDEGRTWSHPVWVHPALSPSLYAPTVKPVLEQASPWDRPVFVADPQTGTIYVSGSGLAYTVDPATVQRPKPDPSVPGMGYTGYPGHDVSRGRTFLRASHDGGRTWGVIYPMDSDQYPGGWFAGVGGFTAAFGHLVVAYNASEVPADLHRTCPCTVLGTSDDDGRTFQYRVLLALPAEYTPKPDANPMRGMLGVMVSADPAKEGRYAVARIAGRRILISMTEDGGKTWADPVVAAEASEDAYIWHHAMKFSPQGDLGMIWKAVYPDKSFDVWSAVSKDHGRTFKTVRVSHAVSPTYNPARGNFMFGDDLSSMDIDADSLYAVWGDNRSGFEGTWFGQVPLSAY